MLRREELNIIMTLIKCTKISLEMLPNELMQFSLLLKHQNTRFSHTHTHARTKKQSKVYGINYTAIATQWTSTGMPGTTQALEPCVANPPGAGLVTHRGAVQVSQIEITEPNVPQRPHTAKQNKDIRAYASPGTHWCYSWVGCFSNWH